MTLSDNGYAFISQEEGVRTNAYQDSVGIWTIGIGFIQVNGIKVQQGDTLTLDQIKGQFLQQITKYEDAVNSCVTSTINQNQFDALTSFSFNEGTHALPGSHLLGKINTDPNDPTITDAFAQWNRAGGRVIPGLVKRRAAEAQLYFS